MFTDLDGFMDFVRQLRQNHRAVKLYLVAPFKWMFCHHWAFSMGELDVSIVLLCAHSSVARSVSLTFAHELVGTRSFQTLAVFLTSALMMDTVLSSETLATWPNAGAPLIMNQYECLKSVNKKHSCCTFLVSPIWAIFQWDTTFSI